MNSEEKQLVVTALEEYPAGIPSSAWGKEEMSVGYFEDEEGNEVNDNGTNWNEDEELIYRASDCFTLKQLEEHG